MDDGGCETVLAMYRAREGRDDDLRGLIAEHVPALRARGLATDRAVILLRAPDGTWVEIFEWLPDGARRAHADPVVAELWRRFGEVCEFVTPAGLPGADRPFPHFRRVEGVTV